MSRLEAILDRHRTRFCLECGKCSAVCPITLWERQSYTSPRLLVDLAINHSNAALFEDTLFWSCLTCARCSELCPADVHFIDFIRDARELARTEGRRAACTHGDVIQSWASMMANGQHQPRRRGWLRKDLRTADDSEVLYFVGCLPFYDTLFGDQGNEGVAIARAAVRILNHIGIAPQVMAEEICCGHDQLFQGDRQTFDALARRNLEQLRASGAQQIVTTCPECARVLKKDYPALVGEHGMQVQHLTEFVHPALDRMRFKPADATAVTYHDACRLGRHQGVYDAPRDILRAMGMVVHEMAHHHHTSLCCGTSCWSACGQANRDIQHSRLKEAQATGAARLVTACIKCQIHLNCARQGAAADMVSDIPIQDITTIMAGRLQP